MDRTSIMTSTGDFVTGTTEDPSFSLSPPTDEDLDYPNHFCDHESVRRFQSHFEPPLFWMITLVGGAGNLAVVWIYLNFQRRLKTKTDVYLLNLAVADLLFLFTLPIWAQEALTGWCFGSSLCKISLAIYKLNLFCSTLLLTCISTDRYMIIVWSTKVKSSQLERRRRSRWVCLTVWLMSLLLVTPELMFGATVEVDSKLYCRNVFPPHLNNSVKILVLSLQATIGFFLPFAVMAFCYTAIVAKLLKTRTFQKHKAMLVILAVVVVFVVSQLPYNSMQVMEAAQASNMTRTDCEEDKHFKKVEQVLKILAYVHACLNPFLYAFVGVRFHRDMKELLGACCCRSAAESKPNKSCLSPLSSGRGAVMSDTDSSPALSL